jgi:5-deoxy-glucuronate isomerase
VSKLHRPLGTLSDDADPVRLTPDTAGWTYCGLRVLTLAAGEVRILHTGEFEAFVLPLSGSATVRVDGRVFELQGRDSVFTRVTDFAYVPRDAEVVDPGRSDRRAADGPLHPAARSEVRPR